MLYNFVQYEVDTKTGKIDMAQVAKIATKEKPKMIVAGYSAYSREIEWQKFKTIADKVGAYLFADIAHTAGLIATDLLTNPVPLCDVVSTTTHKTLRGPRGAIIMCKEKFAKQVDRAVFPGMQGGPHDHITAAKAVAFAEALKPSFKKYSQQIITNARTLCDEFKKLNYQIVSDGTDNHLFVIDLTNKKLNGKQAEQILETVGISVSRSTIPNDPNSPMKPSGIRLGTPAVTTRNMKAKHMPLIANLINQALLNKNNKKELIKIKKEVKQLCQQFPVPKIN